PWDNRAAAATDATPVSGKVALALNRRNHVVAGAGARPVAGLGGAPPVAGPGPPVPIPPVPPRAVRSRRPEQVVVHGRPTLHRQVTALLADPGVDLVVLDGGPNSPNPTGSAAELADSVLTGWGSDRAWNEHTARADDRARAAVHRHLDRTPDAALPTGLYVARAVAGGLRGGDNLVVGASNAIRDLSYVGPMDPDVHVHANRGASGIDG